MKNKKEHFKIRKFTTVNKFKFRAECTSDLIEFQQGLRENKLYCLHGWKLSYSPINNLFADVICVLEIDWDIEQVKEIMRLQDDSHVMIQTIKNYKEYTGERDYDIS
jgi:hypothetical protein